MGRIINYVLVTSDHDKMYFETIKEARNAQDIFGGVVLPKGADEHENGVSNHRKSTGPIWTGKR